MPTRTTATKKKVAPVRKTAQVKKTALKTQSGMPSSPRSLLKNELKVTRRKLSDYQPDPKNANRGTERGRVVHEKSIDQFGAARSVVADANNVILAGNKTVERLQQAGITEVIEVETDGKALVVVKRPDLDITTERGKQYAIYDNRTGELNLDWDADVIGAMLKDAIDLSPVWSDGELAALLDQGEYDPANEWQGMPEFDQPNQPVFKSIKVHFDNEADIKKFSELLGQTVTVKSTYVWFPFKADRDNKKNKVIDES